MITQEVNIRVRYADTDQMGFVYYGNYATYFEVARVEALRQLGFRYKDLETEGVAMPVLENYSKYIRPAYYDDLLTVRLTVREWPTTRIKFEYEIFNEEGTLLHVGYTTLVFFHTDKKRVGDMPNSLRSLLSPYFEEVGTGEHQQDSQVR